MLVLKVLKTITKMGRPKNAESIQLEALFEVHSEQFVRDGKVVEPSDEIWSILQSILKNSTKPINKQKKVIYTAALRWYSDKNVVTKNDNNINNDDEKNVSVETSFDQSDLTIDTTSSSNDRTLNKNVKKIIIKISPKVWRTIEPKEASHKRKKEGSHKTGVRKFFCLEPGIWTNIFANEIAKYDDIPCSWVFKRNKCYLSGKTFLVFDAKCNMCNAILVGTLKEMPEENEIVKIHIEIHGIDLQRHTKEAKKVKLTSRAAKEICLQNKKATVIRRNLIKNTTQMFTAPKSRVMTANAIRCVQYRQRMNEKISKCPITALTYLKASNLYTDCIQRIGNDPFYVIYCTPEQRKLFHAFKKRNKEFKMSCDATGSIVHKIGNVYF